MTNSTYFSLFLHNLTNAVLASPFIHFIVFFIALNIIILGTYFLVRPLLINLSKRTHRSHQLITIVAKNIKTPLLVLSILGCFYLAFNLTFLIHPQTNNHSHPLFLLILAGVIKLILPIALFWLVWRALYSLQLFIHSYTNMEKKSWFIFLFSLMSNGIKAAIILLVANIVIPWLGLTYSLQIILEKISHLLFIAVLGWLFFQIVNGSAKIVLSQYGVEQSNDPNIRKIRTQVIILKRIILTIGGAITCAAMLLAFDGVKHLGASLLTTAGIISAVGAFASQQSLSRLAAGLQMAFTQPIRIGDAVLVENQFGTIEEISLSYIVVKLWNLRRLILPADYLNKTGFYNLTRTSTQLLDTVFFYVDFTLPVQPIREKFFELIEQSPFWDHQIKAFHVTAINESCMELRALMSAKDMGNLWELQCEIREKLTDFIAKNYSTYLPIKRQTNKEPAIESH